MIEATGCIGQMLSSIAHCFLSGSEEEMHSQAFTDAAKRYKSVLASLSTNLREAKFEHYISGTEDEYQIEARLVACMQRLAHNIGGLRSAATTQFGLLSQSDTTSLSVPDTSRQSIDSDRSPPASDSDSTTPKLQVGLAVIDEVPEENLDHGDDRGEDGNRHEPIPSDQEIPIAVEVFAQFIKHLGPSMVMELTARIT